MTATFRMSEDDWQSRVTDYLTLRRWLWVHHRPARTVNGWRTPVSGPLGKGWPDIVAVRHERLLAIELKSDTGQVKPEQQAVLDLLARVPGITTLVARPADWDHLQEVLR